MSNARVKRARKDGDSANEMYNNTALPRATPARDHAVGSTIVVPGHDLQPFVTTIQCIEYSEKQSFISSSKPATGFASSAESRLQAASCIGIMTLKLYACRGGFLF